MTMTIEPRRGGGTARLAQLTPQLALKVPAHVADLVAKEAAAGRAAALAGEVDHGVSDEVEASEEAKREQAKVRRDALLKLLPDKRAECVAGLSCLDADQHPLELQAWLDDSRARTLILAGGTGTGKSQAAYATAAHAARYGAVMWDGRRRRAQRRPLIVRGGPVNNYLRALRPDGSPDPVWQVRNEAVWAELWLGDDLGAELDEVGTRFMREEVADLLDARLERNLRQIYTTNLAAEDLAARLGSRMWSRLQEESTLLVFTGRDRRVRRELSW